MTTKYGSTVQHWRAKIDATISNTDTKSTITVKTYWCSVSWGYSVNGCTATAQCGSYSSGTKTFKASSNTSQTKEIKVAEVSHTYNRGSSDKTVTCKATVKQPDYHAGTSTVSVNLTVPKIDYEKPNAPSGISATRNSDSKITVKWTNGSTSTTKPRSNVLVERGDGTGYKQIAKLSASSTSYADTSVKANNRYKYRVRSYGSGGYSSYVETSNWTYMTPAAPSSVKISRQAGDDKGLGVTVNATVTNVNNATSYDVQYQVAGGSWTSAGTSGSTTSFPFSFTPASGGDTKVRVRSKRSNLTSAWKESNQITTLVPPLQPETSFDQPGTFYPVGSELWFTWTASYPAGDKQTKAEISLTWIPKGDTDKKETKTCTIEGDSTRWQIPEEYVTQPGAGTISVKVWGDDKESSPSSIPIPFAVSYPLQASFTNPASDGATIGELPLEAKWEITAVDSDTVTVSEQKLCLLDSEQNHLKSWDLDTSLREYTIGQSEYAFENETEYFLELNVVDGHGLSTRELRSFTTDWVPPAPPTGEYWPNLEDYTVEVGIFQGEVEEDVPETVSLAVSRYIPRTGETWLIAENLEDGETVIDPLPPLNCDFEYLLVAVSESGVTNTTRLPARFESRALAGVTLSGGSRTFSR